MNEYKIITKGGTMCFYGEWFGRPYDNYHEIVKVYYENECLTIHFANHERLIIFNPTEITNEENCLKIKEASKVIWQYTPYGSNGVNRYIYKDCGNGNVLKTVSNHEEIFFPKENIAVQCLAY